MGYGDVYQLAIPDESLAITTHLHVVLVMWFNVSDHSIIMDSIARSKGFGLQRWCPH